MVAVVPPCILKATSNFARRKWPTSAARSRTAGPATIRRSTIGWSSRTGAESGSETTVTSMDGLRFLSAARQGVIRTVSPIERSRMSSTRRTIDQSTRVFESRVCPEETIWSGCVLFNHCLIDEHYRDVITNGVDAMALGAFQAAPVGL